MAELKTVGKPMRKKDAMNLLLGKPAFVEDVTPGTAWWSRFCAAPTPMR